MGEFVYDGREEPHIIVLQHRREDGVTKPAEGAEGRGRRNIGIIPLPLEFLGRLSRTTLRAETFVRDSPYDRERPGVWRETAVRRSGEDDGEGVPVAPEGARLSRGR